MESALLRIYCTMIMYTTEALVYNSVLIACLAMHLNMEALS